MNSPAVVSHYGALLDVVRARVAELGITHETLDAVAGLQSGYAGKLLCDPPIRRMGPVVLFLVLEALGLQSTISEDMDALARVTSRLVRRRRPRMPSAVSMIHLSPDFMRQIGRKGGEISALKLSPAKRSSKARKAARARWGAVKTRRAHAAGTS